MCREELPHIERLHQQYKDKGLIVLGFNCSDDKAIALDFLKENQATFPNIIDATSAAGEVCFARYQSPGRAGVPLTYIVDQKGTVADVWYGFDGDRARTIATLEKLGIR